MLIRALKFLFLIVVVANFIACVEIHCKFATFDYFMVGRVYACAVEQKRDALHRDSEVIKIAGEHGEKKKDVDVIAVRVHTRMMDTFPSHFEKFFVNLKVIQVYASKLKIITQKDLEPFTKLHHIDLSKNDLETLPRELFKFNVDLLVIKVSENKLKFIDATAFETLHKLHTLELDDNQCIWKSTQSRENFDEEDEITRDDVVNVMYEARNRCYRDVILKELYDMEMGKFLKERNEIVVGLETRITELTEENEMFYNKMRDYKDELDVCKMEEIRMMKSSMVGGQNSSSREMKNSNQYFNGQKLPPGGSKNFQEGSKDRNHLENRFNEIPRPSIQNLPLDNPRGFQSPPPGSVKSDQNRFSDMSRSSNGPNAYLPLDREPQMPKIDDKKRPQSGIPSIMLLEPRNVPQAPSGDFNQRPNYPERDDFYANRSPDEKLPSGYTPSSPTRPFNVDHAKMPYDDRVNERENAYAKDSYMLRSQEQNYGQQWSNWGKRSDNWRY